MNYEDMSDFEISKAVGSAIGINWENLDSNYHALSIWDDGELCVFDPCNSWADAGPIIQRNHIDLESLFEFTNESEEGIAPTGIWSARGVIEGHIHPRFEHANPLRAAMIVFLMMQEGE